MQQTSGVTILDFETLTGFPYATNLLAATGSAFQATNTISPFMISNAVTKISTAAGVSINVQYRAFDNAHNVLGLPDAAQGSFLIGDRSVNDTLVSANQGLVAGEIYYQSFGPGGTYLNFDRNLSQFGVVLKANTLSSTDVICLFDEDGILLGKYVGGIAAGQALYFGVKSQNSLIRSVWIGQTTSTNGLTIDDVSFVPGPAPTTYPYTFSGTGNLASWGHTSGATVTTGSDHWTIVGTNADSKIYRSVVLPSGTYTLSGVGSGTTAVKLSVGWNPAFITLNLGQASGWRSDHCVFSTTTSGTYNLVVQVNASSGTANIQALSIALKNSGSAPPSDQLLAQKNTLSVVRGMVSSWTSSGGTLGSAYYNELKNWRCNVVRLQLHPVSYAQYMGQDFWTAWPAYRTMMVQNIQQAQAAGLKTIIDLHEMPFTDSPPTNQTNWSRSDMMFRFQTLWQDIAQTIVNNNLTSAVWAYELINEPLDNNQLPNPPWQLRPMAANTILTIRAIDPGTWVVFDVGPGSAVDGFTYLAPLPDTRVVYSGHFYYPSAFCLQGVNGRPTGVGYSSATTNLASCLASVDSFAAKWPAPIYIGEFSAARWGPIPDTANWMSDVVSLFEARHWSWTYFAWAEYQGWRLDMDNTPPDQPTPPVLDDNHRTDRGTVIYNALGANPP